MPVKRKLIKHSVPPNNPNGPNPPPEPPISAPKKAKVLQIIETEFNHEIQQELENLKTIHQLHERTLFSIATLKLVALASRYEWDIDAYPVREALIYRKERFPNFTYQDLITGQDNIKFDLDICEKLDIQTKRLCCGCGIDSSIKNFTTSPPAEVSPNSTPQVIINNLKTEPKQEESQKSEEMLTSGSGSISLTTPKAKNSEISPTPEEIAQKIGPIQIQEPIKKLSNSVRLENMANKLVPIKAVPPGGSVTLTTVTEAKTVTAVSGSVIAGNKIILPKKVLSGASLSNPATLQTFPVQNLAPVSRPVQTSVLPTTQMPQQTGPHQIVLEKTHLKLIAGSLSKNLPGKNELIVYVITHKSCKIKQASSVIEKIKFELELDDKSTCSEYIAYGPKDFMMTSTLAITPDQLQNPATLPTPPLFCKMTLFFIHPDYNPTAVCKIPLNIDYQIPIGSNLDGPKRFIENEIVTSKNYVPLNLGPGQQLSLPKSDPAVYSTDNHQPANSPSSSQPKNFYMSPNMNPSSIKVVLRTVF